MELRYGVRPERVRATLCICPHYNHHKQHLHLCIHTCTFNAVFVAFFCFVHARNYAYEITFQSHF